MTENSQLLKFPCRFPLKILGINNTDFIAEALAIVAKHDLDFDPQNDVKFNISKKANYLSITATIMALSQEQLDNVYRELKAHSLVKVVL
jgi:uncharacterized protein